MYSCAHREYYEILLDITEKVDDGRWTGEKRKGNGRKGGNGGGELAVRLMAIVQLDET